MSEIKFYIQADTIRYKDHARKEQSRLAVREYYDYRITKINGNGKPYQYFNSDRVSPGFIAQHQKEYAAFQSLLSDALLEEARSKPGVPVYVEAAPKVEKEVEPVLEEEKPAKKKRFSIKPKEENKDE